MTMCVTATTFTILSQCLYTCTVLLTTSCLRKPQIMTKCFKNPTHSLPNSCVWIYVLIHTLTHTHTPHKQFRINIEFYPLWTASYCVLIVHATTPFKVFTPKNHIPQVNSSEFLTQSRSWHFVLWSVWV